MRTAEPFVELGQPRIGDHRHVGAGMARIGERAAVPLEQHHRATGLRDKVRGRQPRDPTADDNDIAFDVLGELRKRRKRSGRAPVRGGVVGSHRFGHSSILRTSDLSSVTTYEDVPHRLHDTRGFAITAGA